MRIVYVEDNIANVHLVKRVARMGKHEVINYIDGMDAFNNFASDNPDLVLMDIQLAGELTGIEVVKKLRDKGFDAPIYAVTAYAMVGDRERCMEAGCTGYISKPIPIPELVQLFSQYDQPETSSTVEPTVASSATAVIDNESTESTEDLTETKTLVSAATIKADVTQSPESNPTSNAKQEQDKLMDDLNATKTLLSAADIKPNETNKGEIAETKSSKASIGTSSKSVSAKTDERSKDTKDIATVAEFDNDDTISVNKDKLAQMK